MIRNPYNFGHFWLICKDLFVGSSVPFIPSNNQNIFYIIQLSLFPTAYIKGNPYKLLNSVDSDGKYM